MLPRCPKTERPAMNPTRAPHAKEWKEYFALGYRLTLLEVHKLYISCRKPENRLRLRFQRICYGPYADNLRHCCTALKDISASASLMEEFAEYELSC